MGEGGKGGGRRGGGENGRIEADRHVGRWGGRGRWAEGGDQSEPT